MKNTTDNDSSDKSGWNPVLLKYKLLSFIANGSFGVVMKARNRQTKKLVAIKRIEDAFTDSYSFTKIMREV